MPEQTTHVSDPNPGNEEVTVGGTSIVIPETPATPTAPPAVEPAPKPAPTEGEVVVYDKTGDVGLDMALEFVGKAGIHGEHPAMQAAANGDFSLLKAELARKGVAGWEQFVALGEAAYARTAEKQAAANAAVVKTVHELAGGAEQWAQVQQWAAANATPEEKAQINALLNQGGLATKGAVQYLLGAYQRANPATPVDPLAAAGARPAGSVPNGPLSPKEYAVAVQQLAGRLGGRLDGSKEYATLQQRRAAYRG